MRLIIETELTEKEAMKMRDGIAADLEDINIDYHIHMSFDIYNEKRGSVYEDRGQFGYARNSKRRKRN